MSKQSKPWLMLGEPRIARSGGLFQLEWEAEVKFGKETPSAGDICFQLNGVDYSEMKKTRTAGRAIFQFGNLRHGPYSVKVTAKVEVDNTTNNLECERSFTLVPPDLSLDISTPVKIGNSWQMTATATAFVPGKTPRIFAEGEEVKIALDNDEVASQNTNDAGVLTYDLINLSEGQHVVHAVLTSTDRKRQQVIQVGEKPSGPKRIAYSTMPKLGHMGTTILRITVLDNEEPGKGKGVKNTKVWIEDQALLLDGDKERITDDKGVVVHEVSVTEHEKRRGITITVPGIDRSETITFRYRTEFIP